MIVLRGSHGRSESGQLHWGRAADGTRWDMSGHRQGLGFSWVDKAGGVLAGRVVQGSKKTRCCRGCAHEAGFSRQTGTDSGRPGSSKGRSLL